MATSKKITELDQLTTAGNSDLLYIVNDPSNIPTSKKITVGDLLKNANSVITTFAATAYTNSVAYANTTSNTRAATAYTNAIAYAASVATNAYNTATDYTDTVADTLYSNVISQANSLASCAYSNAISYLNANPPPIVIEEKYYEYINGTLNGSGGLANQFSGLSDDNTQYEIPLPFAVTFLGQTYNSVWINSNSYLSFDEVAGGALSYPLGPARLGVPAIMLGSTDRMMTAYYYGTVGNKFIIRYEGVDRNVGDASAPSRIWEIHFDSTTPAKVRVLVSGYNIDYSTGLWGIHDGTRWTDIFEPLPFVDQNNNTTYYGVDIVAGGELLVNKIKFIGAGVETYTDESGEAYVLTDPLHGLLNVDLNDDDDVVLGSAYTGLEIKTTGGGNTTIRSDGEVVILSGSGSASSPDDGRDINIKSGNGFSNSATGHSGGNILLTAGIGANGGANGNIQLYVSGVSFLFGIDGSLTFPDYTIQTTAYTGVKQVSLVDTTSHSPNSAEEILLCDPNTAGADIVVTLPNSTSNGKIYTIKNINDGGYDVKVQADGTPSIIEVPGAGTLSTNSTISLSGNVVTWVYYDGYYRVVSYG